MLEMLLFILAFAGATSATLIDLSTSASMGKSILQTTKFNYIIVGGGVAGLTVARRLTESSKKVLVLEAGRSGINDPMVTIPQNSFSFVGTDIDWLYNTAPQIFADDQEVNESAGKVLGGGSAVNGLVWCRPSKEEFDAFEELGSPGWNWNNIYASMKKSEKLNLPSPRKVATYGYTAKPSSHGSNGPVDVSFPPFIPLQHRKFVNASIELGHRFNSDPYAGDNTGVFFTLSSQTKEAIRVTSEFAYLDPVLKRTNLIVLSHALVSVIDLVSAQNEGVQAKSVNVRFPDGSNHSATIVAHGEVILSAGSIRTPQILELSGIGDHKILRPLGIDVKVDLPGVGANYEDHTITILTYQLKPGFLSFDALGYNATLKEEQQDLYKHGEGWLTFANGVLNMAPIDVVLTKQDIQTAKSMLKKKPDGISQEQFDIIKRQVFNGTPEIEFLLFNSFSGGDVKLPNTSYVSMAVTHLHPLSRGSIHINSSNIDDHPTLNPNLIKEEWDLWLLAKASAYARKFFQTLAFREIFEQDEVFPGLTVQTESQWQQWVKKNINGGYHSVGTASLLPRSRNGVVDPTLKVYGTNNIRVADASIVPLLFSAHTQATAYAIGEKAANIILSA